MSEENVQRYHRALEAFRRRDLDAFLAFFDPEVDFAPRTVELDGGTSYRGHGGIRRWWESMFSVFSDYRAEIDEVQDLGDVTFSRVRLRGHGMESAAPIEQTQWHVVEWQQGVIVRLRSLLTEVEAVEAAGLSE